MTGAEWEARETINAVVTEGGFRLLTGGAQKQTTELRSTLSLSEVADARPAESLTEFIRLEDARRVAIPE